MKIYFFHYNAEFLITNINKRFNGFSSGTIHVHIQSTFYSVGAIHHDVISYKGHTFYLVHNPRDVDVDWRKNNPEGWLIHGHTHDNEIHKYPFINGEKKTINVSAEVTNYRPVSLEYILSLDIDSIERMDTIDSIPQRKISSRRDT